MYIYTNIYIYIYMSIHIYTYIHMWKKWLNMAWRSDTRVMPK